MYYQEMSIKARVAYCDKFDIHNCIFSIPFFRFTQAGSEVSALLGRIPSAVGYQPTLATDMGTMQVKYLLILCLCYIF